MPMEYRNEDISGGLVIQQLLNACKKAETMLGRIAIMEVDGQVGRLVEDLRSAIRNAENASSIERALACNGSPADPSRKWVVSWRYSDGSASGVLPLMFDDRERAKMEAVIAELGAEKDCEFVEVSQ